MQGLGPHPPLLYQHQNFDSSLGMLGQHCSTELHPLPSLCVLTSPPPHLALCIGKLEQVYFKAWLTYKAGVSSVPVTAAEHVV